MDGSLAGAFIRGDRTGALGRERTDGRAIDPQTGRRVSATGKSTCKCVVCRFLGRWMGRRRGQPALHAATAPARCQLGADPAAVRRQHCDVRSALPEPAIGPPVTAGSPHLCVGCVRHNGQARGLAGGAGSHAVGHAGKEEEEDCVVAAQEGGKPGVERCFSATHGLGSGELGDSAVSVQGRTIGETSHGPGRRRWLRLLAQTSQHAPPPRYCNSRRINPTRGVMWTWGPAFACPPQTTIPPNRRAAQTPSNCNSQGDVQLEALIQQPFL